MRQFDIGDTHNLKIDGLAATLAAFVATAGQTVKDDASKSATWDNRHFDLSAHRLQHLSTQKL
jgi:hypothetical protein